MPMPVVIHPYLTTKSSTYGWIFVKGPLHLVIEPIHDAIITVQEMNQLSRRAFEAGVKIPRMADITWLLIETNAAPSQFLNNRRRVILRRVVVDDLDLHGIRPRVLG